MRPLPCRAVIAVLLAATPSIADEFAGFRIPAHTSWTGQADLASSGGWLDTHEGDNSTLRGRSNARLDRVFDSDGLRWDWSASGSFGGDRDRLVLADAGNTVSRRAQESVTEAGRIQTRARWYPGTAAWGLEASVSSQGVWSQRWARDASRSDTQVSERNETAHLSARAAQFAIAAGYGRVRDATAVFAVNLLEERLRDQGALVRSLSASARTSLAALWYLRGSFSAVHDRPERFFWAEVERILRADGAVDADGISAQALILALEALEPSSAGLLQGLLAFDRRRGMFIGPVFEVQHFRSTFRSSATLFDGFSTTHSSGHGASTFDRAFGGARAEFHRPLGWRWQLDATAACTVPLRPDEHGATIQTSADVLWRIADRWQAAAACIQNRTTFEARDSDLVEDRWNVAWGGSVSRFIEDRVEAYVQFEQQQSAQTLGSQGRPWNRNSQLSLAVRYRFLGRLSAPGLLVPQTRLGTS